MLNLELEELLAIGSDAFWITFFGSSKTDFAGSGLVSVLDFGSKETGFGSEIKLASRRGASIKNFFF